MKIGFIGCGNMAKAMLGGMLKNKLFAPSEVIASCATEKTKAEVEKQFGIMVTKDNKEVAEKAEVLVLAVKPYLYEKVIAEIKEEISKDKLIITVAAGKTLQWLTEQFGQELKIVRTMPNTPALVSQGMTGACATDLLEEEDITYVTELLESCGKVEWVEEKLMDVVVSVSGSSPAYVFLFIEAMADAAVADGMPREQAYRFAAQAVLGSAEMVLQTGKHPGELKDMVCTPGGTTIEAVRVLEEKGLRSGVIEAMKACTRKAKGV